VGLVKQVPAAHSGSVPVVTGAGRERRQLVFTIGPGRLQRTRSHTKEKSNMQIAVIYAFIVIAGAPLIGIWRGHMWAKSKGLVLRSTATSSEQNQTA
jgi:hypothetical protein